MHNEVNFAVVVWSIWAIAIPHRIAKYVLVGISMAGFYLG